MIKANFAQYSNIKNLSIEPVGRLFREVHMTDIAPTIATLLRIQMPNGCIGQAIPEVLKQ